MLSGALLNRTVILSITRQLKKVIISLKSDQATVKQLHIRNMLKQNDFILKREHR